MTAPWWTDADQAELDIIAHDLVTATRAHSDHCQVCRAGGACQPLRDAYDAVAEWKRRRNLLSKATFYRLEETAHLIVDRGRRCDHGRGEAVCSEGACADNYYTW